jgi:hypothetical protein
VIVGLVSGVAVHTSRHVLDLEVRLGERLEHQRGSMRRRVGRQRRPVALRRAPR